MGSPPQATLEAAQRQSLRKPGFWAAITLGFSLAPLLWALRQAGGIQLQESEGQTWLLELAHLGAVGGACMALSWSARHRDWLSLWSPSERWRSEWQLHAGQAVLFAGISSSFLLAQASFSGARECVQGIGAVVVLGWHAGAMASVICRVPLPGRWRIPAFLALALGASMGRPSSDGWHPTILLAPSTQGQDLDSLLWWGSLVLASLAWTLLSRALPGAPREA